MTSMRCRPLKSFSNTLIIWSLYLPRFSFSLASSHLCTTLTTPFPRILTHRAVLTQRDGEIQHSIHVPKSVYNKYFVFQFTFDFVLCCIQTILYWSSLHWSPWLLVFPTILSLINVYSQWRLKLTWLFVRVALSTSSTYKQFRKSMK